MAEKTPEKMIQVEVVRAISNDEGKMVFPNKPTGEKDKDGKTIKPKPVFTELSVEAAKKLQESGAVKAVIK